MFLLVYEVTDEMSKYCISWIGGEDKKWVKYEENKSGSPDLSDIKENGRKVMEFISIAHGNQKVRAKNSRNEEDSPKMPVETLK